MGNQQVVISRYNLENGVEGVDYIVCPLCNSRMRKITGGHLKAHHQMNIDIFRNSYPKYPTECQKHIEIKSKAEKEVMSDENFRKRRSESSRKMWKDTRIRSLREDGIRRHHSDPKFKEKCRKHSINDVWGVPEMRDKTVRRMLEANKSQEVKERRSKNMLKLWSDPEFARKVFDGQARFARYILRNGEELVLKSSYEVVICRYLEDLGINFLYEPKRFHYYYDNKHHSYYPDFYLPSYDLFLEVKPLCFQEDDLVRVKFNSVVSQGDNIIFVGEDELVSKDILLDKIDNYFNDHPLSCETQQQE